MSLLPLSPWTAALFSTFHASETATSACVRCASAAARQARRQRQQQRHVSVHHSPTRHASSNSGSAAQSPASTSTSSNTQQTFHTRNGRVRVELSNRGLIGVHQSRGERPYQEDACAVQALEMQRSEVLRALEGKQQQSRPLKSAKPNDEEASDIASNSNEDIEQVVYAGVFDGHNGSTVSSFLKAHLHSRLLDVQPSEANTVVRSYRDLGGYMRRYRGGNLEGLVDPPAPRRTARIAESIARERRESLGEGEASGASNKAEDGKAQEEEKKWDVLQRLQAAFLKTDLEIIKTEEEAGSTCTVALLHSLDEPRTPFFAAEKLHVVVAHCGDTRALLCTCPDGTVVPLTENHHPDARSETDRLMRIRTGAVTDSFGESRWAGTLANTRAFGDAHYKALGVFSEPQLVSKVLTGNSSAFLMLISDGVTEQLSDQEIVDLVRGFRDPTKAARNVVGFAESIGAQDNLTCVIVPLPGWEGVTGPDTTQARREFRRTNFEGRSTRQARM